MTNLYQITVRKSRFESSQSYKEHFRAAFEDILNLTKLLCQSSRRVARDYLSNRYVKGSSWLSFTEDRISICVQRKLVQINRDDDTKEIIYDFDKRLPADDYFILAIIAILKHHLPGSELGKEVKMGVSNLEFNDAVLLAALVNPKVCNPCEGNIVKGSPRDERLNEVIEALVSKVEQNNTVMRKFTGGRLVEVFADLEPIPKIPKLDFADAQEAEEECSHQSESPNKLFQ